MAHSINKSHYNMIEQQVRPSNVLDQRVLAALSAISRADFVNEELALLAYSDTELPIGYNQSMLSPVLEGRLLQALNVQDDEQVLELGTGTGYFTALLAQLAHDVISVELIPELAEQAKQNLAGIGNVELCVGDASQGWNLANRIDVIIATAAFTTVPDEYKHSLKVGGRMLAIEGPAPAMSVQLIHRTGEREWEIETVFETVISPMINAEPKPEFEF